MAKELIIPKKVFVALDSIRKSGQINMFDIKGVGRILFRGALKKEGFAEALDWLSRIDPEEYYSGIIYGMEPDEE